jgi:hypothetical protein
MWKGRYWSMKKLLVVMLVMGVATSAWAGVISVSAETSADPGRIVGVGDIVTILFYGEDTTADGTTGIIGADLRVTYDPAEVDIVSIMENYDASGVQANAPWPLGFQGPVLNSSGAVDDDAGTISDAGGSILTFFGGVPIAQNGSPAVLLGIEIEILADMALGDQMTSVYLEQKAGSPIDTFPLADGSGGDEGLNLPFEVTLEIPEPTTVLILGSGLVGLLGIRSRRRLS